MTPNEYRPFLAEIKQIVRHTTNEYTFRVAYDGQVKPGQFFELSLPNYGEAPISVSGLGHGTVDFTIRSVGRVTQAVFSLKPGESIFMRGPYGNGFDKNFFQGKDLAIIAGGTGLSPVRGLVEHFYNHLDEVKSLTLIAGFKNSRDILFSDDLARWQQKIKVILTVECQDDDTECQIGLVTKYIPDLKPKETHREAAVAIVVGPPIMIKFAIQSLKEAGFPEKNLWISLERKMCCGLGKCGHCKIGGKYICLDGPVFNYLDAIDLVD